MEARRIIDLKFSGKIGDVAYLKCFQSFTRREFKIDFKCNKIKLKVIELGEEIQLKIDEKQMNYLKKEIENGAKIKTLTICHYPSIDIERNWFLRISLMKDIKVLTKEEFKKLQRIAMIGVSLSYKNGIVYSLCIWNRKENSIEYIKTGFLPKIEETSKMLIDIALESIKKYNCNIAMISFEKIEEGKEGRKYSMKIIKRVFEECMWNFSMEVLAFLPIVDKKQKKLRKILIDSKDISEICYKCGSYGKIEEEKFICNNCGYKDNKHHNISRNIAKKSIEFLRKIIKE